MMRTPSTSPTLVKRRLTPRSGQRLADLGVAFFMPRCRATATAASAFETL
jgi:hypothetical protein